MTTVRWASDSINDKRPPHRRVDDCSMVEEIYHFGKKIGVGSFGLVVEGINLKTKDTWAIKIVNKEKAGKKTIFMLEREVNILKKVNHTHIIVLNEVIESPKKMYLIMELCQLGELKMLLMERGPFTEVTTRHISDSLVDAIIYLHGESIVHRDLKLENILVADVEDEASPDPLYNIKLTDFGLSVVKGSGKDAMLQSTCGTPVYMAPEVIQNHDYSQTCDIWSVGVILYALLSKEFPFISDKEEKLYEIITRGHIDFDRPAFKNTSASAKDLIQKLLYVNPAYRITAQEVPQHPWMKGSSDLTSTKNVLELMKEFHRNPNFSESNCDSDFDFAGSSSDLIATTSTSPESSTKSSKSKTKKSTSRVPGGPGGLLPPAQHYSPTAGGAGSNKAKSGRPSNSSSRTSNGQNSNRRRT